MFTATQDKKLKLAIAGLLVLAAVGAVSFYFLRHPSVMDVGYRPQQPVPFDHRLHVSDLGISCVYCHTSVETSPHSTVPTTQTCMNCHISVKADSPKLQLVRESYEQNIPIEWVRVHKLPDYAFFNHSRHINAGIDCASCHGEVEKQGVIVQKQPLTMGWCLSCHRDPETYSVRTREITGVDVDPALLARPLRQGPQNCSSCHH
ncbi:MAG: cytochrome c3 family protein [Bacteroidetes bacterium]|nr:cytochrome c3 family protein [Bacteroidota bacterium]